MILQTPVFESVVISQTVIPNNVTLVQANWTDNLDGSYTSDGNAGYLRFDGITVGKAYNISFDTSVVQTAGGLLGIISTPWDWNISTSQSYSGIFISTGTDIAFYSNLFTGTMSNLKIVELTYGPELISNTDFNSDILGWQNGRGVAVLSRVSNQLFTDGSAGGTYGCTTMMTQPLIVGKTYRFSCNFISPSNLSLRARTSSNSTIAGDGGLNITFSGGSFDQTFVCTSSIQWVGFLSTASGTSFTIDNVSMREVI